MEKSMINEDEDADRATERQISMGPPTDTDLMLSSGPDGNRTQRDEGKTRAAVNNSDA